MEKRLLEPDHSPMSSRAPQESAENIAAALVARDYAVGDQKTDGSRVIRDDAEGDVRRRVRTIFSSRQLFRGRQ